MRRQIGRFEIVLWVFGQVFDILSDFLSYLIRDVFDVARRVVRIDQVTTARCFSVLVCGGASFTT